MLPSIQKVHLGMDHQIIVSVTTCDIFVKTVFRSVAKATLWIVCKMQGFFSHRYNVQYNNILVLLEVCFSLWPLRHQCRSLELTERRHVTSTCDYKTACVYKVWSNIFNLSICQMLQLQQNAYDIIYQKKSKQCV